MKPARLVLPLLAAAVFTAVPAVADDGEPNTHAAGSGYQQTGYATDAYPGFDSGEEDAPEQKKKSWWYSVKRETPATQLEYARSLEKSDPKGACKAYEALVREWPAVSEAAEAQRRKASLYAGLGNYSDAFDEFEYLLDFYPGLCPYQKIARVQYTLANQLLGENRSMFGLRLASTKRMRHRFESVIRHAPGADYVPDAFLTVARLRVQDDDLPEAIEVYENLVNRFPNSPQALDAVYLEAQCRYTLVQKKAYNEARCRNTVNYLRLVMRRLPQHPHASEMRAWLTELETKLEDDAYKRTLFYDTRQRTPQAAVAAYQRFLDEFPDSARAAAVKSRIEAIKGGAAPLRK